MDRHPSELGFLRLSPFRPFMPTAIAEKDRLAVELDTELEQDTDNAIIEMVRSTVEACSDRDADLYLLRQQNEGISQPGVQGPWPNSCIIEPSLTRKFHTTAHSNIMAAFRQKPYATLESLDPAQDEAVQRVETLLNTEADLFGFDTALSDMAYTALESRMCVTGVFYRQDVQKTKQIERLTALPAELIAGIEENPAAYVEETVFEQDPEEALIQKLDVTERIDFEHIDPWDFYLNPVGANSVERASHCVQRVWYTAEQLLAGIQNEDFIEDRVWEMVRSGPTAVSDGDDPRADMETLEGLNPAHQSFFECFRVVGLMPYLMDDDGKPRIGEELMNEDFLWMVCPAHNVVFKRTFSPFPVRPYDVGNAIRVPGRLLGHGVVSMLSAIQDEMTAVIRALIDSINLTMNPALKVPEQWMGFYSKWTMQPGRHFPYKGNDPESVRPLTWDMSGLQYAFNLISMLEADAAEIAAAQGVNSMSAGKVRKKAEVDFTAEIIQNKFALMLANLQRSVQNLFRIYLATRLYHLQDKVQVRRGEVQVDVTVEDLRARCRIIPHANAENASAAQRLQTDVAVAEYLKSSPIWQMQLASGKFDGQYKLDETFLSHLGVRNAQALIGREPAPGTPEAMLMALVSMLMQAAQMDPVAAQILQRVQSMAAQGGAQLPQPPPAVTAAGMTPPDMAGTTAGVGNNGTNAPMNGAY